jgi:hypothetical protein
MKNPDPATALRVRLGLRELLAQEMGGRNAQSPASTAQGGTQ